MSASLSFRATAARWRSAGALALVLAVLGVAGCAGSQPMPPVEAAPISDYRLDSGDKLRVIVFGQDKLSGEYAVDDGGAISIPLLPPLNMRGLTTREAKASIEQALAENLLRNPNVSVEIQTFRPFFILGEVNEPGQYPFVAGMTVETAVAIAGGYTYRASTSAARITRPQRGGAVELRAEMNARIYPGDTVFIRERYF